MSKIATSIGVNQGTGPQLSTFELTSGRQRQTAVVGDPEDQDLLVELPAHGSADRGSPLKIGGQVRGVPFTGLQNGDRSDAWFTPTGALGVVNTIEPATIYDGGRRSINFVQQGVSFNTPVTLVSGTAGQRIKVLGVHVVASNIPAAGSFFLMDASPATLIAVDRFTGISARTLGFTGQIITQAGVGWALTMNFDGASAGTFGITLSYYKAP